MEYAKVRVIKCGIYIDNINPGVVMSNLLMGYRWSE